MKVNLMILPHRAAVEAEAGSNLLSVLREKNLAPEAPCGGHGTCGKCGVIVNGVKQLACQTVIDHDITVAIPETGKTNIMTEGIQTALTMHPQKEGYLLAVDIGTTTVVCYLLDGQSGAELASSSMLNPQAPFGADVISRIQAVLAGEQEQQTRVIRTGMTELILEVCKKAQVQPSQIGVVSVVGNPAMQQLFLGIDVKNLASVPFSPVLTEAKSVPARDILPVCEKADLLIVPDISGYVGADTMGCVLATRMDQSETTTLMVDIGTNGEMALGSKNRMLACSTAAGPALEGARIKFGMRGAPGAIDHVWLEEGSIRCSVIGGGKALGICGSGLIDAIAVLLKSRKINKRGRIQSTEEVDGQRIVPLKDGIYLTQSDIREVQLAKGAIAAGIELMAQQLEIRMEEIDRVLLAGAFGSFMNPESACRIGLLPPVLQGKITAVGNAAGSGAKLMACDRDTFAKSQELIHKIEFTELANLPNFQHVFAKNMSFVEE